MNNNSARIHSILSNAIKNKGSASFIASGGSSPVPIFKDLSTSNLDWANIEVTLVDDRFVNKSHVDSNEKLLNENLLVNKASNASFISLKSDPSEVHKIKQPFDLMLLGMGEDAHFASLFPSRKNAIVISFDLFVLQKVCKYFLSMFKKKKAKHRVVIGMIYFTINEAISIVFSST